MAIIWPCARVSVAGLDINQGPKPIHSHDHSPIYKLLTKKPARDSIRDNCNYDAIMDKLFISGVMVEIGKNNLDNTLFTLNLDLFFLKE